MPKIIVTIAPDGVTSVKAEGYHGPTCRNATRKLREALGAQIAEKRTPEFYATPRHSTQQKLGE